MTEPKAEPSSASAENRAQEARHAALFVSMVLQYSDLAMLALGRAAHPETGKRMRDLEAARLFIDQLEMLEFKTRGNLAPEEASVLRQALTNLRLAFVEEAAKPEPAGSGDAGSTESKAPATGSEPPAAGR
jgi:hypothetical protein